MQSVFHYSDYRAYLKDFYNDRKAQNRSYSFRHFASKAGLNSPNYYKLVMDSQRNLTHRNIRKFAKGLGLSDRETLFFENMVLQNQAKEPEEKEFYQKNLELVRSQDERALLSHDKHLVLTQWYPLAIKEALQLNDFEPKPKWIAGRFDYRFTPDQAREALELLERLGLIEKNQKTGGYRSTHQSMEMPDWKTSETVARYHKNYIDLAKEAIDKQTTDERYVTCLSSALRKQDLPKAIEKINRFLREMDSLFTASKPFDSVYQLNVQLFRLDTDV